MPRKENEGNACCCARWNRFCWGVVCGVVLTLAICAVLSFCRCARMSCPMGGQMKPAPAAATAPAK